MTSTVTSTKETKLVVTLPSHNFMTQKPNFDDQNHAFHKAVEKKTFLSPLLNYFRTPKEETYHLDDEVLDQRRKSSLARREEKGKGRAWAEVVGGSNALVVEGAGTGDWRRPSLWG
ncbi:hypothetical protein FKW77_003977 [Venturia effusa]|uniref:Uncharacterized protein n=1 Tax=Venturia effusa TaxID=50376 RepID=A0A517LC63_9PEZI|nr:hypothetical protein FKW77_003977 [Venturia effusa]